MRLHVLQFMKILCWEAPKNLTLCFPLGTKIQSAWKFHRTLTIEIMKSHYIVLWPFNKKLVKGPPKPVLGELAVMLQVSSPR